MSASEPTNSALVVLATLLSIAGAVFHNVMEFGWAIVAGPETYASNGVLAVLVLAWLVFRRRWLLVTAGVVGAVVLLGTILTVLPLPVLPFLPDQSAGHYLVHGVTAVLQVPLPLVAWRTYRSAAAEKASGRREIRGS